jgi:hypothetical protein
MIEITKEMKSAKEKRIAEVEKKVDAQIKLGIEYGQNRRVFCCDKEADADVYDEVRKKYERAGYKIVPTGYSGGVWQLTEDICW